MRGVVWQGPRALVGAAVAVAAVGLSSLTALPPADAAPVLPLPPILSGLLAAVNGTIWGDAAADKASLDASGHYSPALDTGSLYNVTTGIGARTVWSQKDSTGKPITGTGVTVALVDSGVQAVPGLTGAGKIVRGPDLSLEENSDGLSGQDTFGHGTHLAGIIAGHDTATAKPGLLSGPDASQQMGVAPDSSLLALKLATTDGSTDVSQVIAALDWVSQHRTDNGMNVRVINLSFGTGSLQPYQVDPLAAAAEHAWKKGIVVVVSGGNGGAQAGGLTDPAIDPYVIAVGASAPGALGGWSTPTVADFSSVGTTARHVDLLAPGKSIVSFRDPGSFVDQQNPQGLVAGDASGRLFRGSGTSQAAAVVSGAAALVLQANPKLTPDQVKGVLMRTAHPILGASAVQQGSGELDVAAAVRAVSPGLFGAKPVVPAATQTFPAAAGTGSLEGSRGLSHLYDASTGSVLAGETDIMGTPWNGAAWSAASVAGTSWQGGLWMGAQWTGSGWTSTGWARARWADTAWARARWADANWDAAAWERARWADAGWQRARWASASFS